MAGLNPVQRKFLLHWGEMGGRWGINRTVAQVHALLYLSPKPLHADDLVDLLGVSRSGISGSLHELQNWRLIKVVHVIGDRRDHFEAVQDPYQMFAIIIAERKRRELDPVLSVIRECIAEADASATEAHTRKQLLRLGEFAQQINQAYARLSGLAPAKLARLLQLKSLRKA